MSKFGNCPYCYGLSICITVFIAIAGISASLLNIPLLLQQLLYVALIICLCWTLAHLLAFIVRMNRVADSLHFSTGKRIRYLLNMSLGFTRASLRRVFGHAE